MTMSVTALGRRAAGAFAACAIGGLTAATIALPTAGAQPASCDASGFATMTSGVLSSAGGYLANHPGANDALTRAATQPPAESEATVRDYFTANPTEWNDLRGIVQPLTDMRNQCGFAVAPAQLANLVDALTE